MGQRPTRDIQKLYKPIFKISLIASPIPGLEGILSNETSSLKIQTDKQEGFLKKISQIVSNMNDFIEIVVTLF